MRYSAGVVTVIVVSSILCSMSQVPAFATDGTEDVLAAVSEATPNTIAESAGVEASSGNGVAIQAEVAGADVLVPADASRPIVIDRPGADFSIAIQAGSSGDKVADLPGAAASFDHNDGSVSVPVVVENGGLQINTVITTADAPNSYSYDLTLPLGGRIEPIGNGYVILDASSDVTATILDPWAKDANGSMLPTHFEL